MSNGRTLQIQTDDGTAEAYLAGDDGNPGVLFYVDAIGLRPQTEQMADRIASWGYTVLAPHVFYRDGSAADLAPQGDLREDGAREAFFASGVMDRVNGLTPDKSTTDARAFMATLSEHAADGPVGTTGYCMGARLAVRVAAQFPGRVLAVGGFHGGGLVTPEETSPHTLLVDGVSYTFGHADNDGSMPPEAVATLGEKLAEVDGASVNEVYEGAPHGYSMADTSMYHEEAAERHFDALRAVLDSRLT